MKRFWAVRFGSQGLPDPEGRYRLVVGVRGTPCAPDCLRLSQNAIQDGNDPRSKWPPANVWDDEIQARNLWMRDAKGTRVIGWGHRPGRYVVDLSKTADWTGVIARMLTAARQAGYDGIQLDDASEVLFHGFGVPAGCWDPRAWRENSRAIIRACAGPRNAMAGWWRTGYTRPQSFDGYGFSKIEGFRFGPKFWCPNWGGPEASPKTWHTYFGGDAAHLGILGLERLGVTPLIEAHFQPEWTPEMQHEYALVCVATTCLADKAMLAYHAFKDWANPVWTPAHQMAWDLGEPVAPCRLSVTGQITRAFEYGRVVVNPTDRDAPDCAPHSARILCSK